jgi:PilZ domain
MNDYIEKRACRRNNYTASITCTYFNADRFYSGKTTNHSKEGLLFESDFPLKTGASVYIRIEDLSLDASGSKGSRSSRLPSLSLAQVRWCKEIHDPAGNYCKVGLKYYQPAV